MLEDEMKVQPEEVEQAAPKTESKQTSAPERNRRPDRNNNGNRGGKNSGRRRDDRRGDEEESPYDSRLVSVGRITKVVKGGRRLRFNALVVIGDGKGLVGFGTGKAHEVPDAIKKATKDAEKNLIKVPLYKATIPHIVTGHYGAGEVLIKPAVPGTGISAGGPVRAVMELAGVEDILSKSLGSHTPVNVVRATFNALSKLRNIEQVAEMRGIETKKVLK